MRVDREPTVTRFCHLTSYNKSPKVCALNASDDLDLFTMIDVPSTSTYEKLIRSRWYSQI